MAAETILTLDRIPPTAAVLGAPSLVASPYGPAMAFDGSRDGLILPANPLEGAVAFTIEALFRPASAGPTEQRFVHVHDDTADARALLETRVVAKSWYGDVFIRTPIAELPLNDSKLLHACDVWHTLALVYDGRTLHQYVDGVLELSGQIARGAFGRGRVSLGCRINQVFWFKGAIRTVKFIPAAVAPAQLLRP